MQFTNGSVTDGEPTYTPFSICTNGMDQHGAFTNGIHVCVVVFSFFSMAFVVLYTSSKV